MSLSGHPKQHEEQALASLLKHCSKLGSLQRGRAIHALIVETRSSRRSRRFLHNLLIRMYGCCESTHEARSVFDAMGEARNVYSWTILLKAYAQNGHLHQAMHLYRLLCLDAGCVPNRVTFVNVLAACTSIQQVRMIHSHMDQAFASAVLAAEDGRSTLQRDVNAENSLVAAYGKLGSVLEAKSVFDQIPVAARDVVSWNSMLAAYAQNGCTEEALQLFYDAMDVEPDEITFVTLVDACGRRGDLAAARAMDHRVALHGLQFQHIPVVNALISMYSSCSSVLDARRAFEAGRSSGTANVVTWTAMITALATSGNGQKALKLLGEMISGVAGVEPNSLTLMAALEACDGTSALVHGKWIHRLAERYTVLKHDLMLNNALLSMYSRCGGLDDAMELFSRMKHRSVVTWAAMIGAYARKGDVEAAFDLFYRAAQEAGRNLVDDVTFISLLTACSHAGKLDTGLWLLWIMMGDYKIAPHRQHYACMVDLLARAGRLAEARELLHTMPFYPDIVAWTNFVSACAAYSNLDLAEETADQLTIACSSGRPEDAERVKKTMLHKGISVTSAQDEGVPVLFT